VQLDSNILLGGGRGQLDSTTLLGGGGAYHAFSQLRPKTDTWLRSDSSQAEHYTHRSREFWINEAICRGST